MHVDKHIACPQCGYDLYGISEGCCPECGFRYDIAAIKAMTHDAEWTRLATAQNVIVRSTMTIALSIPHLLDNLGVRGMPFYVTVVGCSTVAFAVWASMTNRLETLGSATLLMKPFAFAVAIVVYCWRGFRLLLLPAVVIALTCAWYPRLLHWPALSPYTGDEPTHLRRSVERHSIVATVLIVIATLLTLQFLIQV